MHADHSTQVFYISQNGGGGSLKYIEDLITHYGGTTGISFIQLSNKNAVNETASMFHDNDILIFQYAFNTDFEFKDVAEIVRRFRLRLVIPIHDHYFLDDNPGTDYTPSPSVHTVEPITIPPEKLALLHLAEHLIFPSEYIRNIFLKYVNLPSMVVVPHIDQPLHRHFTVPHLVNSTIRIGIITRPTYVKGQDIWESLCRIKLHKEKHVAYYVYSDYNTERFPEIFARGAYQENDIYCKLKDDSIHGLLFLNRCPETYSYALTKGINSGRPILYSRMGAIADRLALQDRPEMYIATNNTNVEEKFVELLDFIVVHAGTKAGSQEQLKCLNDAADKVGGEIMLPEFYSRLFSRESKPPISSTYTYTWAN